MPEATASVRLVHAAAFADPGLTLAGDRWWAYGGAGPAGPSPALSSVDLVHWEREPDALPTLGSWAVPDTLSSPTVVRDGAHGWLLYYAARQAATGGSAIGVAAAAAPGGPFRDTSTGPLLGGTADGGDSADASVLVRSDGNRSLTWTTPPDGRVWTRPLAADGRSFAGPPAELVVDGPVNRPQIIHTAVGLLLICTATAPGGVETSVAVARSSAPDTGFVAPRALLASSALVGSPAHGTVVRGPDDQWWLLFPAFESGDVSTRGPHRRLWLAALDGIDDPDGPHVRSAVPPPVPLAPPPGQWRLPLPTDPTGDQEAVLRSFTVHGLIRALPARHARRVVLLDLLAQLFEPGLRYPESEVDRRLSAVWAPGVHRDYARLRRLLVDHGFLDRTGGIYRRSGGTV